MAKKNDGVTDNIVNGCMSAFDNVISGLRILPKDGTHLKVLADSGMEMVECYRSDCAEFCKSGDHVTAFAAINYAHAWIGCLTELGLLDSRPGDELYKNLDRRDSDISSTISDEKMGKYLDITTRARKKLKIAPPVRSFDRRLATSFLEKSESYFIEAVGYRNGGDYVKAFAAVNYAHAWLDCGARIGLFDVDEDDVLFTLFD